jgi:murein DD-endopeptidase MepM/ murein hydrolase activator NlpD
MTDVDYHYPCKTHEIRDDFEAHVKRGSVLPGVDFACNTGDAVFAAADGHVALADGHADQERGRNIIMTHHDGRETHYLHLSKVLVRNGERVKVGDKIAESGNTGTTTTGAHLHFAVKLRGGKCIDPESLLRKDAAKRRKTKQMAAELIIPEPTHLPDGS